MMAFDMGGPLNKTAYAFATTGLGAAATATDAPELKVMAAVMLAGMVPPLALALATVVRPKLFTIPERENGKAAWAMGASFITEGAIPFAAADPLRVIPSIMAGSAVTGALSMGLDVSRCAHRTAASSCSSPSTGSWASSSRWSPGTLVGAALVVVLKSVGTAPTPTSLLSDPVLTSTHQQGASMPSKSVVVGSAVGLHARPAAIIAEAAGELGSEVTINGVDASSSLMIMTLGAGNGDTVEVAGDDQSAVDAIAALVEQDLDA